MRSSSQKFGCSLLRYTLQHVQFPNFSIGWCTRNHSRERKRQSFIIEIKIRGGLITLCELAAGELAVRYLLFHKHDERFWLSLLEWLIISGRRKLICSSFFLTFRGYSVTLNCETSERSLGALIRIPGSLIDSGEDGWYSLRYVGCLATPTDIKFFRLCLDSRDRSDSIARATKILRFISPRRIKYLCPTSAPLLPSWRSSYPRVIHF